MANQTLAAARVAVLAGVGALGITHAAQAMSPENADASRRLGVCIANVVDYGVQNGAFRTADDVTRAFQAQCYANYAEVIDRCQQDAHDKYGYCGQAMGTFIGFTMGARLHLRGYTTDNAHRNSNGETPLIPMKPWTVDEYKRAMSGLMSQ